MLLYHILASAIHKKNTKKPYKGSKFKISATTWNKKFELPDGSYSVSDVQDYFELYYRKTSKSDC